MKSFVGIFTLMGVAIASECPAPPTCNTNNELMCTLSMPGANCPMDSCVPKYTAKKKAGSNKACNNFCPMTCPQNMIECGITYDIDGCEMPQVCRVSPDACPKSLFNPNGCAINNDLPPTCPELTCPPTNDEKGCPSPPTCATSFEECPVNKFDFKGCPIEANPPMCKEKSCPAGFDDRGCNKGIICVSYDATCPESLYDSQGCLVKPEGDAPETCGAELSPCAVWDYSTGCISGQVCSKFCE